ncbi:MAG TPA: CPBP family intramembrane glutamic endopeptidase, partial [Candidatus Eisenbacteria bacterium]|nr:CPBP family intramembrane glutamic endopeptidase [Candidatus Eisenbacteria bacterium]
VLATGRSTMPWSYRLGDGGAVVRRLLRILVYLLPLPLVPLPPLGLAWWALAAALLVAAAPLLVEAPALRRNFRPSHLRLLPPLPPVERLRDLVLFAFSGLAQEYLYRYLLLFGLEARLGAAPAVAITAALFVGEHLAQRFAAWDRHDLAVQGWFGVALGTLTLAGRGLAPAILAHTLYNTPALAQTLVRPGIRRVAPAGDAHAGTEAP